MFNGQVAFSRFSWAENYSENDGTHSMRPRPLRRVKRGEGNQVGMEVNKNVWKHDI